MKNLLMTAIAIFGLAIITMAQVPSYVPASGIVGWWPFNGNANDESGNGNNGINNGATLTTDRFGNVNSAYYFDGNNDNITVNQTSLTFGENQNFSISLWFKTSVTCGSEYCGGFLSQMGITSQNGIGYQIGYDKTNNFKFEYNTNSPAQPPIQFYNISNVIDNNWHLITVSVDKVNNTIYIYSDGILSNTITKSWIYKTTYNTNYLFFGMLRGSNYFYNGSLDDIGIWDRALTQQEITNLYNGCPRSINSQPANQTININNNAQFVVSSSDTGASFRWQTDLGVGFQNLNSVGQYSGASSDTLNVANVTMSNNNQPLRCIVSSGLCSDTSNVAVLTVKNNVGVNEFKKNNLFSVYPNPTKGVVFIEVKASLLGSNYIVYSSNGAEVLSGSVTTEVTTLGIQDFAEGVYFIQLGEDIKQSFKILKQ